jgi:lysozyme
MNIEAMREELLLDEGLKLKPYRCTAGKLSIGVGRNLDDLGISRAEALLMLDNDIQCTATELDARLPWWRTLDEVRQRVILNMAFNLGIKGLLGFKNTLAAVQAEKWEDAANGMLASRWAGQVGARAQRLAQMMAKGAK